MPITIYKRQVGDAGLPGIRQEGRDVVGRALEGVGRGVADLGQSLDRAAEIRDRSAREQDAAAVNAASAQASSAARDLLYDPKNGYTNKRGQNALADYDSARNYFEQYGKTLRAGLANDRQRLKFDQDWQRELEGYTTSIDRHVAGESQRLDEESFTAVLGAKQSAAVAAARAGSHDLAQGSVLDGLKAIDERAQMQGWTDDMRMAERRKYGTGAHLAIVDGMLEQDRPTDARQYLTSVRRYADEFDEAAIPSSLIGKLEAAERRDRSRSLADEAWARATDRKTGDTDTGAAVDWLRSQNIEDTQTFDDAVQRVGQRASQEDASRRLADEPRLGRLEQQMIDPKQYGYFSQDSNDFQNLSDKGQATALRMWQAETRTRKAQGSAERAAQNQYDLEADAYFRSMAANDPESASQLDITQNFPDVSNRYRYVIGARQGQLRDQLKKGRGVQMRAFSDLVRQRAGTLNYDKETTAAFSSYMHERYWEWVQDPKNDGKTMPPPDVVNQMVADALTKGYDPHSGLLGLFRDQYEAWSAAQNGVDFAPFDGPGAAPVPVTPTTTPGVPAERRPAIEAKLRQLGKPVTDANVQFLYNQLQQAR